MKQAKRPQKTRPIAFVLAIISSITVAAAQLLLKLGSQHLALSVAGILTNYFLILGFAAYGLSAALLVVAFRFGKLSVLYPMLGLGFIWVALFANRWLAEPLGIRSWAGIAAIVLGVTLIGRGEQRE